MVTIAPGVVTIGDGRTPAGLRRETGRNAQEGGGGAEGMYGDVWGCIRAPWGCMMPPRRDVAGCNRLSAIMPGTREERSDDPQAGRGAGPWHTQETPYFRGCRRRGVFMGMYLASKWGVLTKPDETAENTKTPENIGVSAYFRGFEMVARVGIEPTTRGFSVPCSTN